VAEPLAPDATRKVSQAVIQKFAPLIPSFVSGSADLLRVEQQRGEGRRRSQRRGRLRQPEHLLRHPRARHGGDRKRLWVVRTWFVLKPLTIRPGAWILAGSMLRLLVALLPTLRSALRWRRELVVENLALRQQLATPAVRRHPVIRPADRFFWIFLRRLRSGWAERLAIVRPDTVVRWHRAGFRIYWNWLSRRGGRSGRPSLPQEVRALIRRMAIENSWGAPRIHGELLRLGFDLSERSASRYLRSLPRAPRAGQTWTTFLRNHRNGIAAMDFFSVPTVTFRVLQVLVVILHGRRVVAHCAVVANPTATWVAQQLREAFPFDSEC
jgi:hypothetical protein